MDGTTFEVEDLERKESLEENLSRKPASAPHTPVVGASSNVPVAEVIPAGTPNLPVKKNRTQIKLVNECRIYQRTSQ